MKKKIPIPGQRILRSAFAVALCLVVYILRGHQGIPLYSALAALQCMQPYTRDMKGVARKRILGTVIGAVWGLLLLLIEIQLISDGIPDERLHYILVPLMLIAVLYSTVLLHVQETAYFSGVVFLVITINHFTDANPYLFAFHRLLDTVIGVIVATVVNRLHLPRRRNSETLYLLSLDDALPKSGDRLPAYSLFELNHLMDDGAKFSLSTVQTQATVREMLPGLRLRYPIITMDGAALYDMGTLEYLRTAPMPEENAEMLMSWLKSRGTLFFANSIEQNLLVIRYETLGNDGMKQLFEKKRNSPYRNFVRSSQIFSDHVVYLLILDTHDNIHTLYQALTEEGWAERFRVVMDQAEYEGYSFLKIYDASCSQGSMRKELEAIMGTKETRELSKETFDGTFEPDAVVKEMKKSFEPIDLHCWKSIFHR